MTNRRIILGTVFLDALGYGLLIPVLPDVVRRFDADPSSVLRYFDYFIVIYAVVQFVLPLPCSGTCPIRQLLDKLSAANGGAWPRHVHVPVAEALGLPRGVVHAFLSGLREQERRRTLQNQPVPRREWSE